MASRAFTLHIRLTKRCNADCSYCSSYEGEGLGVMSIEDLEHALDAVIDHIRDQGATAYTPLFVQYLGGELLTIPPKRLDALVALARMRLTRAFYSVTDGAQSNLLASEPRVRHLFDLFEGRVGTSVDHFTNLRTLTGDAQAYQSFFAVSDDRVARFHGRPADGVIVADHLMARHIPEEIRIAEEEGRALTFRPIFEGGSSIETDRQAMHDGFLAGFDAWAMTGAQPVEPYLSMIQKRLAAKNHDVDAISELTACAFHADCTKRSLCLEPNGDLYLCQEMADAKLYRLGNALTGERDIPALEALESRPEHLHEDCRRCRYRLACRGGCAFEAIADGHGPHGKPENCSLWIALFERVDELIKAHGILAIQDWIDSLGIENSISGQVIPAQRERASA